MKVLETGHLLHLYWGRPLKSENLDYTVHEFSGDVVEVGEGVTKVKVGDHVSGAPLKPCMKCDDCQNGNFSLCKHYSFIGSREQGSNADYVVIPDIKRQLS